MLFRSKGDTFAFIETPGAAFTVASLCRRYGGSPAGFHAWRQREERTHATQDRVLVTEIARVVAQHAGRYGSPRLYPVLTRAGWCVSRRRVARLMRLTGLRAKAVRITRAKRTMLHQYARHPNRLWRASWSRVNQVWVGDLTSFRVGHEWRYPTMVMHHYSRRLLAGSLTRRRTAAVTCAVLTRPLGGNRRTASSFTCTARHLIA